MQARISRYARGRDYHDVLKERLTRLSGFISEIVPGTRTCPVVDTGAVLEKPWGAEAGLGWAGKHTNLIDPDSGSWFFLGELVTDLEVTPDESPVTDRCGTCTRCLDACPTQAFPEPYVLDARRCISYLTIELRGSIPAELRPAMGRQVFGCDICQDVCPWNRAAPGTQSAVFQPRNIQAEGEVRNSKKEICTGGSPRNHSLFAPSLEWLVSLDEEEFREVFRSSAVKRTKWRGLVRNACVALGNSGLRPGTPAYARSVAQLERLAESGDEVIAEHARWALDRLHAT